MDMLIVGILLGWLIPRPAVISRLERHIWEPIKDRFPGCRKWFG